MSSFSFFLFVASILVVVVVVSPTGSTDPTTAGSLVVSHKSDHNYHSGGGSSSGGGGGGQPQTKPRGLRGKNSLKTRDLGHHVTSSSSSPSSPSDGFCELEIHCKGESTTGSLPVKLPIRGARGPPGAPGEKGERGADGGPGFPGLPGQSLRKKVAFFVGLTDNFGPVDENSDIIFDRVVTNVGSSYNPSTGRFTAPATGVYQFNVIVSAQGREKAAVMVLKNGEMMATVWAESIPYWATSSNIVVLNLHKGDQVWLLLLSRASHLHGYMYTTFSGFIIFDL